MLSVGTMLKNTVVNQTLLTVLVQLVVLKPSAAETAEPDLSVKSRVKLLRVYKCKSIDLKVLKFILCHLH